MVKGKIGDCLITIQAGFGGKNRVTHHCRHQPLQDLSHQDRALENEEKDH